VQPGEVLAGMPRGWPASPDDLFVDDAGEPVRLDKGFSWEYPLAVHALVHNAITNAWRRDPYPIDVLLFFMANMAWNSAMNTTEIRRMLADQNEHGEDRIPFLVVCDAFASETVALADLVLPDTTYLERHDVMSILDRPISEVDGPILIHLYSEVLQKFRLAAEGKRPGKQPPERLRKRVATYLDPLPFYDEPLEGQLVDTQRYRLIALTQRPMAIYHSWDSQNAWLRQVHAHNDLFLGLRVGRAAGFADGDWVWVESPHGKVRRLCRFSEAVEPAEVWPMADAIPWLPGTAERRSRLRAYFAGGRK
jgi:anaerobic selenocysteine-containing dehydrogenase